MCFAEALENLPMKGRQTLAAISRFRGLFRRAECTDQSRALFIDTAIETITLDDARESFP